MRRVLTQAGLAVVLAATLGAAPGQKTSDSAARQTPVFDNSTRSTGTAPALQPAALKHEQPPKPYQVGNASWYGGLFHGKLTASGETYDMYRYTAAHQELPLGTWVKVTNVRNKKSVIVRINDRGPVTPGRIIDLSFNAARDLNIHARGVAKVRVDIVKLPEDEVASNQKPPFMGVQ